MSRCSLARSSSDLRSCVLEQRLLGAEAFGREPMAILGLGELGAHLRLGLVRAGRFAAQAVGGVFAIGQEAALLVEPRGQLLHAAAEDFGLGRLRDDLAVEIADAGGELFGAARSSASCWLALSASAVLRVETLLQVRLSFS